MKTKDSTEELLSMYSICKEFGCKEATIRRFIRYDMMPRGTKYDRRVYWKREQLDGLAEMLKTDGDRYGR